MSDAGEEKRKIIIDEDWKSQVEQERARLKDPSASEVTDDASPSEPDVALPAPSFLLLVSSLTTQALVCLGQIPDPVDHATVVHADLARHYIQLLEMLDEKTRGNLTEEENRELQEILHQLRMVFVTVKKSGA